MSLFYSELAQYWPLISPVEEYERVANELLRLVRERRPTARTLLELGSGGGHLAHYLARHVECHLSDLSEAMLEVSRSLNPSCAHTLGDMRTLDLGATFDVVLAYDAIDYNAPDGRGARLFEWSELVAPGETAAKVHYSFLIRDRDGTMRSHYEPHLYGLFPRATWERLLAECGFDVEVVVEQTDEDRTPRLVFFGHKHGVPAVVRGAHGESRPA